ncbi:MAG: sigma-54 dependent transcriptional regulator [Myxococcota bacterium]|nr:sigma-54 dependent transcriptional regulator [Myxococcota bacterium]
MARLLVVDDEEGIRSYLAEALARDGHTVLTAADGLAASRLLDQEAFDLILTDLKMPGMDGMALLQKVRAEQPDAEVIMLTAHGSIENAVAAMRAGAYDYLTKPVGSPAELRLVASRALERRALLNLKATARGQGKGETLTWGAPSMLPVVAALRRVAATQATVLLLGESGTGKEVAARALHTWSERADGPFVAVNCAALTETLLESELFGHEKGAFTGANVQRRGRIELAQGGTFFLDEIGELRPAMQTKLLRVLQERRFERVGGTRTLEADVRWVAATNRDLGPMMSRGEFREDLYHRLAVFPIQLPPLRDRPEDLPPLASQLLERIGEELGRRGLKLGPPALAALQAHRWPGNVRELRNVLERAAILSDSPLIDSVPLQLPGAAPSPAAAPGRVPEVTLEELERMAITQAIASEGGNRKRAAERLGIGLRTLYDKLKRYGETSGEE